MKMNIILVLLILIVSCNAANILHISDIHLDLEYHEGASSNCWFSCFGCCHPTNIPFNHYQYAYKYGSRMCGAPTILVQDTLNWLHNRTLQDPSFTIDLILYTGDTVGNHVTYLNPYRSFAYQKLLADMIHETFPNTPTVFTPGNHDTWPINQYGRYNSFLNNQWYESWKNIIPKDQIEEFLTGAYYSISPYPGLRIMSINSLWGETKSFVLNEEDAEPMYIWINSTLSHSRINKEKVYLIYHIFFGNGEQTSYMTSRLRQLFTEYNDIIIASFTGHSHKETNYIYRSMLSNSTHVSNIHMNFVTPALKYEHGPASFRIYQYNNITYEIENLYTYQINTLKSQEENHIVIEQLESYKQHLNMTSFTTTAFDSLYKKMKTNKNLFDQYMYYFYKDGTHVSCNTTKCRLNIISSFYL